MALKNKTNGQYVRISADNSVDFLQGEIYKDAEHREDFKKEVEFTARPKNFSINLVGFGTNLKEILLEAERDTAKVFEDDEKTKIYDWVKSNVTVLYGADIKDLEDC